MKKYATLLSYGMVGGIIFVIERLTKFQALMVYQSRWVINQFVAGDLALNRGISWGFFHSQNDMVFSAISCVIGLMTLGIAYMGIHRFQQGHMVFGELLVVIGSLSNLIDRFYYKGVIDFIELSYGGYSWPLFNMADVCIVGGVLLMVMEYYTS